MKDAIISGYLEVKMSLECALVAKVLIGTAREKNQKKALFGNRRNQRFLGPQKAEAFCGETLERKRNKMIKKQQLYLISQIVSSMEELTVKLENAYNNKNAEELKQYKKLILEFHKKLSAELEE